MNEIETIVYENRLFITEAENASTLEQVVKDGFTIYEPKENELILDIDMNCYKDYLDKEAVIKSLLEQYLSIIIEESEDKEWFSKSATRKDFEKDPRHIVRTMSKELPIIERILIELLMGSDRKKALFDYLRVKVDNNKPHLLFKPTDEYWEKKRKDQEVEKEIADQPAF